MRVSINVRLSAAKKVHSNKKNKDYWRLAFVTEDATPISAMSEYSAFSEDEIEMLESDFQQVAFDIPDDTHVWCVG